MAKVNKLDERIKELEQQELKLFHSYNRHAQPIHKLKILTELSTVIIKLDELKSLNN
jgi:hypothetical protein